MRRVILALFLLIPFFVFADVHNRGRLDYKHHEWEFIIPLLLLIVGGGFFLFYWAKEYWQKHKDDILGFLSFMIMVSGIEVERILYTSHSLKMSLPSTTIVT